MIDFSKIEFKETPSVQQFATRIRGGITLTAEVTIQDGGEVDARKFAREEVRRILHHSVYGELRQPIVELLDLALRSPDFETVARVHKLRSEIQELLSLKK